MMSEGKKNETDKGARQNLLFQSDHGRPLCECEVLLLLLLLVASVVSDSVRPHRQQPTRPRRPWDSPGKSTGVGCHFLLQCMKVKVKSLSRVRLLATPWTAAHQAPPSLGFSRQEYWSGVGRCQISGPELKQTFKGKIF